MAIYKDFDINTVTTVKPWGAREEQAIKDIIDTLVVDTIDVAKNTTSGHLHGKIYADDSISSFDSSTTDSVVITLKDDDSDGLIIKNRTGTSIVEVDSSTTTPKATFNYDADVVGKLYGDIYDLYDEPMIETRNITSTVYYTSNKTANHDFNLDSSLYTFRIHDDATEIFRIHMPALNAEATFAVQVNVSDDVVVTGNIGINATPTNGNLEISTNQNANSIYITDADDSDNLRICQHIDSDGDGIIDLYDKDETNTVRLRSSGDSYFLGGDLGIGTNSPSRKLHLYDDTSSVGISIEAVADDTDSFILFKTFDNSAYIGIDDSASLLKFNNVGNLSTANHLVINASGDVGIGTDSPSSKLEVADLVVSGSTSSGSSGQVIIKGRDTWFRTTIGSLYSSGAAYFGRAVKPDTTAEGFLAGITGTTGGGAWVIDNDGSTYFSGMPSQALTEDSTPGTIEKRFVIDSSGNVGVGIDTPAANLQIKESTSDGCYLNMINSTTGDTINDGFLIGINAAEEAVLTCKENTSMKFSTNNTQRMVIDNSGLVGIGTGSPSELLHIEGSSAPRIKITDSGDSSEFEVGVSSGNGAFLSLYDDAGSNNVLIRSYGVSYFSGGNVGIGENSPDTTLHVNSGSGDYVAHFESTDTYSIISFADNTTYASLGWVGLGAVGDKLVFRTGGSRRMMLDDSGNLGIGTETPGERLHVYKALNPKVEIEDSSSSLTLTVGTAAVVESEDLNLNLKAPSGNAVKIDTASFFGLPVKTDTGDPVSPAEGYIYVNTFDNAVRLYADSSWRSIFTW